MTLEKIITVFAAVGLAAVPSRAADVNNNWQAKDGDYSGSYTDSGHWSQGVFPDVGHRAYFNVDASYKVTFPEGVFTNSAAIKPSVYSGETVEIDGSETTLVRPSDPSNLYPSETFGVYYGGTAYAFMNFEKYGATPSPNGMPDFAISNFHYVVSSSGDYKAKAEFLSGGYNFFDPPESAWTTTVSPYFIFFGNSGSPLHDAEIVFGSDTSFRFPTVRMQGNAKTNRLVFAGGSHTFAKYVYMPYTQGGTPLNDNDAKTTLQFKDSSEVVFEAGTMIGVTSAEKALNRRWEWLVEPGAVVRNDGYISHYYGHLAFDIAGEWTIGADIDFNCTQSASARVSVRDGGVLRTTVADKKFFMGKVGVSADSFFSVTNASVFNAGSMLFGDASFKNALLRNDDELYIGYAPGETTVSFVDSVVTNNSIFAVGRGGSARVGFTGTSVRLEGAMYIGGSDKVASSVATATVDVASGKFDLYGDAGIIYIGYPAKRRGVFNFSGGELTATRIIPVNVGWFGNGELNISGGRFCVNHIRTGATYTSGTDTTAEDVIRVTGGELEVTSLGSGYGIGISENANRRGRLVLDGGVVKCHKVCGDKGTSAFEADGGTLKAIHSVDYQLFGFGEAKLGEKGLLFDCGSYDVVIAQSFEDKDDAQGKGRLILTGGDGSVALTGDLSGLSTLEVRGGTVDILGRTVGNLVMNGGVLKVDPAKPIVVNGELELNDLSLSLSDAMTLGTTSTVFVTSEPLSEASMAKWAECVVASGLEAGHACSFAQKETDGGYVLTVEVRESKTTEIRLDAGTETRQGDYLNERGDVFAAVVAEDAALTLAGDLKCGALEKSGGGSLTLEGAGNRFLSGWKLLGGRLAFGDVSALGLVPGEASGTLVDGTLEFTGSGSVVLQEPLEIAAATPTNAVIVKVSGDVVMPAPTVSSGSLIKRGPGRLTIDVSGEKTLLSGRGFTSLVGGAWPFRKELILPLVFDEANGTVPDDGSYGCLNVLDGELRLRGIGDGAKAKIKGVIGVGLPTLDGSVQPKLVVDNLETDFSASGQHFVVAPGGTAANTFVNAPEVVITNGSYVLVDTLSVNRFNNRTDLVTKITLADRSVLRATYQMQPDRSESGLGMTEISVSGGSKLLTGSADFSLFRPVRMRFDASVFAKNDNLEPARIFPEVKTLTTSWVDAEFVNGSEFRCSDIIAADNLTEANPIRILFDDSKWIPVTDADFEFSFASPEKISLAVSGRGLVLDVPSERTWILSHSVTGEGGLVKQGGGTLKIGAGYALYGGKTRCEAGVVDLDGSSHSIVIAGGGVFSNGTVSDGGIAIDVGDDGEADAIPAVSDVSFAGRIRVNLGRTSENPLAEPFAPIAVCTCSGGAAPDFSGWRLRGTGLGNVRGVFSVSGSTVYVTPERTGGVMIVR